jgi:hypothetical protein
VSPRHCPCWRRKTLFLQKILFTHRRHVADIARDRPGAALDIIALGD